MSDGTLRVEELTRAEDLAGLAAEWNGLLARSDSDQVFLTSEWLTTWWEYFRGGRELFVLLVRAGARLVGIAPWMIEEGGRAGVRYRRIEFLGTGLSDRADLILAEPKAGCVEAILRHLADRSGAWTLADLREWDPTSGNLALFAGSVGGDGLDALATADSLCPYIPITSDWESFYETRFGHQTRRSRNKRFRALQKRGRVEFEDVTDPEELPEVLRGMAEVEARLAAGGTRSVLGDERTRAFLLDVGRRFLAKGWLHVALLKLDGRIVAYHFAFRYGGAYYGYYKAYDPDLAAVSPGTILVTDVIRRCFEDGLREFDLLRGEESWKSEWTSSSRRNRRLVLNRADLKSRMLSYLYKRSRALAAEPPAAAPAGGEARPSP